MCVNIYLYVYMCTMYVTCAHRALKKVEEHENLELHVVVTGHVGARYQS